MTRKTKDALAEFLQNYVDSDQHEAPYLTMDDCRTIVSALEQPEIIHCKDCKHRIVNENYGKKGYLKLKALCEIDTGDIFQSGRNAMDDEWYCADAERREDE